MSYTTTEKFNKSNESGAIGEKISASILSNYWGLSHIKWNRSNKLKELKEWDFSGMRGGVLEKYEIKTDTYEYHKGRITNNMFLERSCGGRPSGITTTRADFFVYYYPYWEIMYIMNLRELKKFLQDKEWALGYGGDKKASYGWLINRFTIGNLFSKIEDIPKELYIKTC